MAAGLEEQGRENVLTDTERRLLSEDVARQTAYAVVALSSLTEEFGLEDALPEMADTLRSKMAVLSSKEQRRLRKSLQRAGSLLADAKITPVAEVVLLTSAHEVPEPIIEAKPVVVPDIPEAPKAKDEEQGMAIEPSEQPTEPTQPTETEIAPELVGKAEEGAVLFDRVVVEKFYERINARSSSGNLVSFKPYDEDEVIGLISLHALEGFKKTIGLQSAGRLTSALQGASLEEINQMETADGRPPLKNTAYSQFMSFSSPTFMVTHLEKLFDMPGQHETKAPHQQTTPMPPEALEIVETENILEVAKIEAIHDDLYEEVVIEQPAQIDSNEEIATPVHYDASRLEKFDKSLHRFWANGEFPVVVTGDDSEVDSLVALYVFKEWKNKSASREGLWQAKRLARFLEGMSNSDSAALESEERGGIVNAATIGVFVSQTAPAFIVTQLKAMAKQNSRPVMQVEKALPASVLPSKPEQPIVSSTQPSPRAIRESVVMPEPRIQKPVEAPRENPAYDAIESLIRLEDLQGDGHQRHREGALDVQDIGLIYGVGPKAVRTIISRLIKRHSLMNTPAPVTRARETGQKTDHYRGKALEIILEAVEHAAQFGSVPIS